ncbi:CoA transferase [Neobacillus niacini]|uniref:CoA transferase n=1 Tax=Neobacillus niacini TaxID=86668 RepID=UPI003000D501
MKVLNGGKACYEIYRTKDNRFISVGALEFKFWENFCQVIGKEEFIDQLDEPLEQLRLIKTDLQATIQDKTLTDWLKLFEGIDACVSPVLTPEELADHPQIKHRQMIEDITHPEVGVIKQIGNPIKLSNSTVITRRHAPGHREHTKEILKELGF